MNEPKKNKFLNEVDVNVKTLYRPFKRCFKYPTNTVTKHIFEAISRIQFNTKLFVYTWDDTFLRYNRNKHSNSRGNSRRVRYASIKGCCKLKSNGNLI